MHQGKLNGKICVICPTIRDSSEMLKKYGENARQNHFDVDNLEFLIITEDFCDRRHIERTIQDAGLNGRVFDEKDRIEWMRSRGLGDFKSLIPRRSHAETSFGLLWLFSEGFDYGLLIDDDTLPNDDDFFGGHMRSLTEKKSVVRIESANRWVNVLYSSHQYRLHPRGYPYSKADGKYEILPAETGKVVLSQGLWTNVPDLDAVRLLAEGSLDGESSIRLDKRCYGDDFVVAADNYLTVCSMNLAFSAEVVPCFYQLPMDDNPQRIGRFDDIWSGLILKKICDKVGYQFVTGHPLCVHNKAPRNIFSDLRAEVNGLEINEHLSEILDSIRLATTSTSQMYTEIGHSLKNGDWSHLQNGSFLNLMGARMIDWARCCDLLR